ncbi:sulfotransferase [Dietzia kunjamensis]|nr:sulfotransferase [Dietzia kunjamensis]
MTAQPSYTSSSGVASRPSNEWVDELDVTRVHVVPEGGRIPGQLLNLVVFPTQIAWRILTGPRRDMIMCSTAPQVTLGFAVSAAARLRGSRFVYHCMDLHPEIGGLSGEFGNPVTFRVLSKMDQITMRRADTVIVLSQDMKAAVVARDASLAAKIEVINNFALPDDTAWGSSPLAPADAGTLRVVFTGNIGRFQGLETAVEAVRELSPGTPVELVFMGEGRAKESLAAAARAIEGNDDRTITFLPHGPAAEAKALMRTSDLGLVSLIPEVVKYAYPSKTASYAVEGLPLLVACDQESELARTVQGQGLGLSVPPGDVNAMVQAIETARQQLAVDGGRGWKNAITDFAAREFDEQTILDRWSEFAKSRDRIEGGKLMPDIAIIVGAPRSGTNMLRDVLTSLEGFATWPCDEINLMWKHGNLDIPHDELTPEQARPEVVKYLRNQFQKIGRKYGAHTVVEKTCATSLRVGFASAVFPEARFIFIRRDGVDAAPSAMKRWNAPFELKYTLKKVRWVPRRDLPRHLSDFAKKRLTQICTGEVGRDNSDLKVSTWWGPRPADFRALQRAHSLDEVSTVQWKRCVDRSMEDLEGIPSEQVLEVVYEEFVRNPAPELKRILAFLGHPEAMREAAVANVSAGSVGKGRGKLGPKTASRLDEIAGSTLKKLGYA